MIILDRDGEEFIRETGFDVAVPVHVEQNGEETKIFAYPFAASLCETYETEFADDLFSDAAIDCLRAGCRDFCRALGYHEEPHPYNWGYNFIAREMAAEAQENLVRIRRDGKYKNKTTFDIGECLAAGRVIYAVIEEDAIVSVAVTAEAPAHGAEWVEIGTETAVGYRNRGYARAAVRALSAFLTARGFAVLYKCHRENKASIATAKSAGFDELGKFYYYVLRKDSYGV